MMINETVVKLRVSVGGTTEHPAIAMVPHSSGGVYAPFARNERVAMISRKIWETMLRRQPVTHFDGVDQRGEVYDGQCQAQLCEPEMSPEEFRQVGAYLPHCS